MRILGREANCRIRTVANWRDIRSSRWNLVSNCRAIIALFTAGLGAILGIFAIFGIIIIVGAAMMYAQPRSAKAWGIVVLILGIISLFGILTTLGGILSLIGGVLAIVWKPSAPPAAPPPPP